MPYGHILAHKQKLPHKFDELYQVSSSHSNVSQEVLTQIQPPTPHQVCLAAWVEMGYDIMLGFRSVSGLQLAIALMEVQVLVIEKNETEAY